MGTDRDWEKWGRNDAYFGVLSNESYRAGNLSESNRRDFFASGETHVARLLHMIRTRFTPNFIPVSSLDFGCGVGRLLIPLARCSDRATGVDVSPSMRIEALRNCKEHGIRNVELVDSDDQLSAITGEFNLVHSHIVFAHIAPDRGHRIIELLSDKVCPGGFIAVQVLYACNAPSWVRGLVRLRYRLPLLNALRNILRGRPLWEPAMQLHVYNLPTLLRMLRRRGFGEILMIPDVFDNGQFDSVVLLAQRTHSTE